MLELGVESSHHVRVNVQLPRWKEEGTVTDPAGRKPHRVVTAEGYDRYFRTQVAVTVPLGPSCQPRARECTRPRGGQRPGVDGRARGAVPLPNGGAQPSSVLRARCAPTPPRPTPPSMAAAR